MIGGRLTMFALSIGAAAMGLGQSRPLSLEEAVQLAKQRNGTVRSAYLGLESAKSRERQAFADFLPAITPSFRYSNTRAETYTGPSKGLVTSDDGFTTLSASWRLLDAGQRDWSYRAAKRLAASEGASALQTLRDVLFEVQQEYFDTLRAQELFRVADAQVIRAKELLDQTLFQIELGAAPKKDRLQAEADYLNAKVSKLQAENQTATTAAQLKATIGWDDPATLPELQKVAEPSEFPQLEPLDSLLKEGLDNRPDIRDLRLRVESQRFNVLIAEREASITWSLDATYDRSFSPDVSDDRRLTFLISMPLFDGGFSRESARQASLSWQSLRAVLVQSQRQARAEIEAAYSVLMQDIERVQAAKAALDAAKLNYQAAFESQRMGAEGTSILTVLTAQVSLVTAESNYVEALYDYFISGARLRLAVGRPLLGEGPSSKY